MNYSEKSNLELLNLQTQLVNSCKDAGVPVSTLQDIVVIENLLLIRQHKAKELDLRAAKMAKARSQFRQKLDLLIKSEFEASLAKIK